MTSEHVLHLGGFQEAADTLSMLSKRKYSRQAVHQLWKRRSINGFPDRNEYFINGYTKYYFDMEDIRKWYDVTRTNVRGDEFGTRSTSGRFISD